MAHLEDPLMKAIPNQTLKDHIIVCGYGRMGRMVAQEFTRHEVPFVMIEKTRSCRATSTPYGVWPSPATLPRTTP